MTRIDKLKKKIKALEEKNKKLKKSKSNHHYEIKELEFKIMQQNNLLEMYSSEDFQKMKLKEFHRTCMRKGLFSFPVDQKFYDHNYKENKVFYTVASIPVDIDHHSRISLKVFVELEKPSEITGAEKRLKIQEIILMYRRKGINMSFEEAMTRHYIDRDKNQAAQIGLQEHKLSELINEDFVTWAHSWGFDD